MSSALWLLLVAAGPGGWHPHSKVDGVATWVLESAKSRVPRVRGEIEIEADLFEILAVLHDVSQTCEWTPNCREAHLIRDLSAFTSLIYLRTASPWPVADRDLVIRADLSIRPDGGAARAEFNAVELPEVPPVEGVIRIRVSQGAYDLTRLGPTRTRVRYEVYSDPGGSVPAALARGPLVRMPRDTLLALAKRTLAMRGRYESVRDQYDPARQPKR
ncbi:MAG: hypothetical protein IT384_04165 [Deltaproteobacteria bacterium]|nr:hypothetical protein [Deltaproteobacteria bacterium]